MLTFGTETGTVQDPCVLLTSLPDTLWCPVLFVLSVSCDSLVRPFPLAHVKTTVRVSPITLSLSWLHLSLRSSLPIIFGSIDTTQYKPRQTYDNLLYPGHHPPCDRKRRALNPLHSRRMRSIAPWRYTTLPQVMSPSTLTTSTTRRLLK